MKVFSKPLFPKNVNESLLENFPKVLFTDFLSTDSVIIHLVLLFATVGHSIIEIKSNRILFKTF